MRKGDKVRIKRGTVYHTKAGTIGTVVIPGATSVGVEIETTLGGVVIIHVPIANLELAHHADGAVKGKYRTEDEGEVW